MDPFTISLLIGAGIGALSGAATSKNKGTGAIVGGLTGLGTAGLGSFLTPAASAATSAATSGASAATSGASAATTPSITSLLADAGKKTAINIGKDLAMKEAFSPDIPGQSPNWRPLPDLNELFLNDPLYTR